MFIGIYKIEYSIAKNNNYSNNYETLLISEDLQTSKVISYRKNYFSDYLNDAQIRFNGLGSSTFTIMDFNFYNKKISLIVYDTSTHSYFSDGYVKVKVYDIKGKLTFEREFIGNINASGTNNISFEKGYKIEIMHREPRDRLKFYNQRLSDYNTSLDTNDITTTYVIGNYGLEKESISESDIYQNYYKDVLKYFKYAENSLSKNNFKINNKDY